jgi:membrane associated rhomboid family serine protease
MSLTLIILIITVGLSFLAEQNQDLKGKLLFNAYAIKHDKQWYRWISHAFIHSGYLHLAINMWVFYMFGTIVENTFIGFFQGLAPVYFSILYLGGVIVSSASSYKKHQDNIHYNSLGASGAVASVMFAFILFYPTQPLYLFFIPIGIPAFLVGVLYLWYESYMAKRGGTLIAHDAHFWGAIFGVVFVLVLLPGQFSRFIEQVLAYVQSFIA